ncbi:hypothetical protein Goari_021514 [Gossypium aridum]|uniref:Uncharacterized protein n=1 Tax=Gossypium aridum TaxID=34290 RepID=A0A7J8YF68_GOSAI|nr:hypothetical protein [Gossypium aridum]
MIWFSLKRGIRLGRFRKRQKPSVMISKYTTSQIHVLSLLFRQIKNG